MNCLKFLTTLSENPYFKSAVYTQFSKSDPEYKTKSTKYSLRMLPKKYNRTYL